MEAASHFRPGRSRFICHAENATAEVSARNGFGRRFRRIAPRRFSELVIDIDGPAELDMPCRQPVLKPLCGAVRVYAQPRRLTVTTLGSSHCPDVPEITDVDIENERVMLSVEMLGREGAWTADLAPRTIELPVSGDCENLQDLCEGGRNPSPAEGLVLVRAVTLIRSSSLSDAAEYAYAATAPADARLIFLAGSCPLNEDGSTAGVGDFAAQAAKCVENMSTALAEAGADINDVISTRVLVASSNQSDLVTAWEVVRDTFGGHDVPSTLLGVTVLGYDDQLVEIEAVAAVRD